MNRPLRIATYNIHKARGLDGRTRLDRVARVLQQLDADLIGLQEVVGAQAHELAQRLGYAWAFGEARRLNGAPYGNATLFRPPLQAAPGFAATIDLTAPGREPRIALRTDLRHSAESATGACHWHVFNLHLGTSHGERRVQSERLATAHLLRALDLVGPRIVLGDFNEWTHGDVTRRMRLEFAQHVYRRGYPAGLPLLGLDHIYWDGPPALVSARLHRTRTALVASDHLPLIVEIPPTRPS